MKLEWFWWFNLLLGFFFIVLFMWRRQGGARQSHIRLKMRYTPRNPTLYEKNEDLITEEINTENETKNLNVIFMWNGEHWDAYEILGLPAGSRRPAIEASYKKLISSCDEKTKLFYSAAYEALLREIA